MSVFFVLKSTFKYIKYSRTLDEWNNIDVNKAMQETILRENEIGKKLKQIADSYKPICQDLLHSCLKPILFRENNKNVIKTSSRVWLPTWLNNLETFLNPIFGKSIAFYFEKAFLIS